MPQSQAIQPDKLLQWRGKAHWQFFFFYVFQAWKSVTALYKKSSCFTSVCLDTNVNLPLTLLGAGPGEMREHVFCAFPKSWRCVSSFDFCGSYSQASVLSWDYGTGSKKKRLLKIHSRLRRDWYKVKYSIKKSILNFLIAKIASVWRERLGFHSSHLNSHFYRPITKLIKDNSRPKVVIEPFSDLSG